MPLGRYGARRGDHDAESMASAPLQGLNSSVRRAIRHLPEREERAGHYRLHAWVIGVVPDCCQLSATARRTKPSTLEERREFGRCYVGDLSCLVSPVPVATQGTERQLLGRCGQSTRGAGAWAPLCVSVVASASISNSGWSYLSLWEAVSENATCLRVRPSRGGGSRPCSPGVLAARPRRTPSTMHSRGKPAKLACVTATAVRGAIRSRCQLKLCMAAANTDPDI